MEQFQRLSNTKSNPSFFAATSRNDFDRDEEHKERIKFNRWNKLRRTNAPLFYYAVSRWNRQNRIETQLSRPATPHSRMNMKDMCTSTEFHVCIINSTRDRKNVHG